MLTPQHAVIEDTDGLCLFIRVEFEPIGNIGTEGLEFDGTLALGNVWVPSTDPAALAGQSFGFDTRCEQRGLFPGGEGYTCIEESVFFAHSAQAVHVSRLSFDVPSDGQMPLGLESTWDFNPEAVGIEPFNYDFTVPLRLR